MSILIDADVDTAIKKIIQEFSDVTIERPVGSNISHNVTHHIITKGPPVVSKVRRLELKNFSSANF